jgi:hemoglobin
MMFSPSAMLPDLMSSPRHLTRSPSKTSRRRAYPAGLVHWLLAFLLLLHAGCRIGGDGREQQDFFTSGSPEADQRAAQRMAQAEQLAGSESEDIRTDGAPHQPLQDEEKLTLFERLGSGAGVARIVDDFIPRVLNDPRVNWQREGVEGGGLFRRNAPEPWPATHENVERLKKHMTQFISLVTGGPPHYDGGDMVSVHAGMRITNSEFDATIGDLKVSLDKLRIPNREQKELLAIMESTRPQIVTQR